MIVTRGSSGHGGSLKNFALGSFCLVVLASALTYKEECFP